MPLVLRGAFFIAIVILYSNELFINCIICSIVVGSSYTVLCCW